MGDPGHGRFLGAAGALSLLATVAVVMAVATAASGSDGTWERAWGKDVVTGGGTGFEICTVASSCKTGLTGTLGGELDSPADVTTDASGNLYVADFNNDRIQKFDSSGNFLLTWGRDVHSGGMVEAEVCSFAASCQAGLSGGLGGEFDGPNSVATDASGNVYVFEVDNARVQKFDSSGNFLRAWGKDVVTGDGTGFEICTAAASCKPGENGGELGGEFFDGGGIDVDAGSNV